MSAPYEKIAIIGVGLIGGSAGMDIIKKNLSSRVWGWGRNPGRLKEARDAGACTHTTTSLKEAVSGAELVLLCTPVEIICSHLNQLPPLLDKETLLMDAGSVKEKIVGSAFKNGLIGGENEFVGAHPMAGSEKSGVKNACCGLFRGAACIITPHPRNSSEALKKGEDFWRSLGGKVIKMSPREHDRQAAFLSHLPHILSTSLARVCGQNLGEADEIALNSGPSFDELTRIAASSPRLWTQIYSMNKERVEEAVDTYIETLKEFKKGLKRGCRRDLQDFIEEGGYYRKFYIKKRQEQDVLKD